MKPNIFSVLNPGFWLRNHRTNKVWDNALNKLLDKNPKITDVTRHTCKLDGIKVWVANWPHAYGHKYISFASTLSEKKVNKALPSRRTILRLRKYLYENYYKAEEHKVKKELEKELKNI